MGLWHCVNLTPKYAHIYTTYDDMYEKYDLCDVAKACKGYFESKKNTMADILSTWTL